MANGHYDLHDQIINKAAEGKPKGRVTVAFDFDRNHDHSDWYVVNITVAGLDGGVARYKVDIYTGEPFYHVELDGIVIPGDYEIFAIENGSDVAMDIVEESLNTIAPAIFKCCEDGA